jgi:hypothetical protein
MIQSVWLSIASVGFSGPARQTNDEFESDEIIDLTPSPVPGESVAAGRVRGRPPGQNWQRKFEPQH